MVRKTRTNSVSTEKSDQEKKSKESAALLNIYIQYENSINALKEFFVNLSPIATEIDQGIEKKQEDTFKEIFTDFNKRASKEEKGELERFIEFLTKTSSNKIKSKSASFEIKSNLVNKYIMQMFNKSLGRYISGIHRELLNKSILLSLVSYFEILISRLAHSFYNHNPNAILSEEKTYSIKDISKFSTIDEILRAVTSDRIDKLLRDSISDWREFFRKNMKFDMVNLANNWEQFNEYFQRRNLVVHTGGIVSNRYLSCINWDKLTQRMRKPSVGDTLKINDDYIEEAIKDFEVVGLLLSQEVWKKLLPNDDSRYKNLITDQGLLDSVYRLLLSRNWSVAELLASWGESDNEASEDEMLVCKFNRWLCIKRQGRWSDIKEEVTTFDCSAKNHRYLLVKACLQDEANKFFYLLPKVLGSSDISIQALKEWPIFEEMRNDSRFSKSIETTNANNV